MRAIGAHVPVALVPRHDHSRPGFDPSTFGKNRQRLPEHDVARQLFTAVARQPEQRRLLSEERFTVDGTLIGGAASLKTFKPKDQPPLDEQKLRILLNAGREHQPFEYAPSRWW